MYKIYDSVNKYLYAQGATERELIDNWNKNAKNNFSWILENYQDANFYNQVIVKCYRIENIKKICRIVNDVEINCLALYRGNKLIDFDEVLDEI